MRIGRIEAMWGAEELRPAVGWKVWRVESGVEETRLRSVLYGDLWPARQAVEARCKRLLRSEHNAPCPGCGCGIHAGRELSAWEHYLSVDAGARVFGRVLLWGATIEGRHGWRAARACPIEIFVPADVENAADVAAGLAVYGVPVHVLEPVPAPVPTEVALR
jgi:hypothetical protein